MKKIVLTGGGTAGTSTLTSPSYRTAEKRWEIHYIGTHDGIERS